MASIRRTVALVAFAALVAGAFSIRCYTVTDAVSTGSGLSITFPQSVQTGSAFQSCILYTVSGSTTAAGIAGSASGKMGTGSSCTCSQWASATGCNGVTLAQEVANARAAWVTALSTAPYSNGVASVTNPTCCDTELCNTGLGITISAAALPVVNMLTLLATALVGYVFTAKMV